MRKRISTHHRDRDRAKQQADELAAESGRPKPQPADELTLRTLFDIYLREVTPSKGESTRKHDHRCAEMFLRFFGANRKASTLNRRDWDKFINERRRGVVAPKKAKKGKAVGSRVIAYDLKWLIAVFNWATLAGDGKSGMLLDRNPLRGLKVPKKESPKRPIMFQDRYDAMLAVAERVEPRFGLALALAHETGHRVNSIRQLRWSDIDLQRGVIGWRAENDKTNNEHSTPLSLAAVEALKAEQRKNPAVGEAWVFPSPSDAAEPCSRYTLIEWWERAEDAAELEHVPRMGWHSL